MTLFKYATTLLVAMMLALPVLALSLDEAKNRLESAKSEGQVGEMPTGYLGVVSGGGDAEAIAEAINEARRAEYARIAEKHNIPVTQVEAVAGKKAMEKTPSGQYIQANGRWVRK
ncbi:YdbL family protein [Marinobacter bryozoorum]|uniref:YdbL family protein n=1 Tax=Marinobacter bryozoorum TaxID=256324 RepID=UPI0020055EAD|nr:YdbL family protein [Marinobacter bryozoorum]MCK7545604.1 YdbL family protein [Marinobacter bryozoorum]